MITILLLVIFPLLSRLSARSFAAANFVPLSFLGPDQTPGENDVGRGRCRIFSIKPLSLSFSLYLSSLFHRCIRSRQFDRLSLACSRIWHRYGYPKTNKDKMPGEGKKRETGTGSRGRLKGSDGADFGAQMRNERNFRQDWPAFYFIAGCSRFGVASVITC